MKNCTTSATGYDETLGVFSQVCEQGFTLPMTGATHIVGFILLGLLLLGIGYVMRRAVKALDE